jgi:radical SAM superfamily enzyme YgiQ (UPF0313 family)
MNVVLVNPPNHRCDVDDLAPPLGLLMLAESLMEVGANPAIVDFNLESCRDSMPSPSDFYSLGCERILALDPDFVCFTSMGINSHVALELARRLKRRKASLVTVFGGPHFASIACELKKEFRWVNHVVGGPGEASLPRLIGGLNFQKPIDPPAANARTAGTSRLHHPWSAYSTINLTEYFATNPRRVLNLETGRGCKFKCKFCYSPTHWREHFDFDLSQVTQDFKEAARAGASHLFLVQDNFLNDRCSAAALCLNLADIPDIPSWNCYGTLRDIDEEMAGYLGRGGCIAIYIGIDAVTSLQKRQFGKSAFNDEHECTEKVKALVANSITPTCAFILDPLTWSDEEIDATLRLAMTLRLTGAQLSLHFLTAYNNTAFSNQAAPVTICDDFRVRLMFDCPEIVRRNPIANTHPSLFPFHARPAGDSHVYRKAVALIQFAQHLLSTYPHEMADLVATTSTCITDVIRTIHKSVPFSLWECPEPIRMKMLCEEVFERMLRVTYGFVKVEEEKQETYASQK